MLRRSVLLFVLTLFVKSPAAAHPRIGDAAPAIDLRSLDGGMLHLGTRSDRIVVVDFFATWCGPCQQTMSALSALLPAFSDHVSLIIIDVAESPAAVRAFVASHPFPAGTQVVIDPDGQVGRRWGQDRLPTTFLIDGQGIIRHINRGYGPGYAARMTAWLGSMVKGLAPGSSPNPR